VKDFWHLPSWRKEPPSHDVIEYHSILYAPPIPEGLSGEFPMGIVFNFSKIMERGWEGKSPIGRWSGRNYRVVCNSREWIKIKLER
jgi:hypothetical protein